MENNHKRGSGTVAFLIGAVAGGVAALLLAPQSGAETRGRIRRGAHDLREKGASLRHRGEERASTVTGAIKNAVTDAKHTYQGEMDRQRDGRTTVGQDPKRFGETEMAGTKPRTGAQS
jgi:gas vesicle protein